MSLARPSRKFPLGAESIETTGSRQRTINMFPRVSSALLCVIAMLPFASCKEQPGSGNQGSTASSGAATSGEDGADGEKGAATAPPSIPDARALGIKGWQDAKWTGTRTLTEIEEGALSKSSGALQSIADGRPGLSVIPGEDGRHHLTGQVEPGDTEAILSIFASAEVKAQNITSVPPDNEILSLGEMAAAVIELVGYEPSADALVGQGADPDIVARLERAARAWPEDARVWRVVGLPPGADDEPAAMFGPDNDPENDRDEARHRRLRDMGILGFAPVEGGGLGDLVTGQVELQYQGRDQLDRTIHVRFAYDRDTDRWALISVLSMPNMATVSRLMRAGEHDKVGAMAQELDFLSILPECHIVAGGGGPLLCK